MLRHVCLGQFDTNGKNANSENDAGELECDRIGDLFGTSTPRSRVENICAVRPYKTCISKIKKVGRRVEDTDDDAKQEGPDGFSDIQLLLDEEMKNIETFMVSRHTPSLGVAEKTFRTTETRFRSISKKKKESRNGERTRTIKPPSNA